MAAVERHWTAKEAADLKSLNGRPGGLEVSGSLVHLWGKSGRLRERKKGGRERKRELPVQGCWSRTPLPSTACPTRGRCHSGPASRWRHWLWSPGWGCLKGREAVTQVVVVTALTNKTDPVFPQMQWRMSQHNCHKGWMLIYTQHYHNSKLLMHSSFYACNTNPTIFQFLMSKDIKSIEGRIRYTPDYPIQSNCFPLGSHWMNCKTVCNMYETNICHHKGRLLIEILLYG